MLQHMDLLMEELAACNLALTAIRAEASAKVEELTAHYVPEIELHRRRAAELDLEIREAERAYKQIIFAEGDRVKLEHGVLIRELKLRIYQSRKVLARLEELGRMEAIRIAKSVDWAVLESWTDEELAAAGTRRKPVEEFGYDLTIA